MPLHPPQPRPSSAGTVLFGNSLARWAIGLTFLVLAANWIFAVGLYQANVLFWDQWSFFTPILEGSGWWGIFDRQHGPHRQGLAFLLTSWIMGACSWDERVDSAWICCVLFLAAALALLLKRRLAGPLRAADAWIVAAILALGQFETVITTPNASHSVFPFMLTLVLAHIWLSKSPAVRYLLSALCTAILMFTGFGLFAAGVSTLLTGFVAAGELRAGRKGAALHAGAALALSLASGALFLRGYVFDPAAPGFRFPWTPLYEYGQFLLLMLAAPAGWEGASMLHYAAGLVCLAALLAVLFHAARLFLRNPALDSPASVTLLLGLSSLLYCADTAVGRVQLGVAEGLTSRYITLVTSGYLCWYLWAARSRSAWRYASYCFLWALVAWPYAPLLGRPRPEWMGSLGLTDSRLAWVRSIAERKLSFAMLYRQDGDPTQAAKSEGSLVFPEEEKAYLDARVDFLRQRHLSLFAHPEVPFGFAPWMAHDVLAWLSAYAPEGNTRWLGSSAELEVGTRAESYLNFRILEKIPALPSGARLAVDIGDRRAEVDLAQGSQGVSLPVSPGSHLVRFESAGGAFEPGNGDGRTLSFLISDPGLSPKPAFQPWLWDPGRHAYATAWDLKAESGFQGWENGGSFAWMSDKLSLSLRASVPVYLNVVITERLAPLKEGPIVVSCEGFRREFALTPKGLSFSLMLAPRAEPYPVRILNSTGAVEPSHLGASSDGRSLALRLTRLSVDEAPAYQVLTIPK